MRVVIVGAGPAGLYSAIALARRGHEVTVIDRDGGSRDPEWSSRRGVMQFHHPHFFREQVRQALEAEIPEVWAALLEAGAVPVANAGPRAEPTGFRCRRATFERHLRNAAERQRGVRLRVGHADQVLRARGRATGVQVGGRDVACDLVLDASGRAGRLTRQLRGAAEGGDCGIAYVSRQYQLRTGAAGGPTNAPPGLIAWHRGYLAVAFPHEQRTLSVLIARRSSDHRFERLRHPAVFDVAAAAIPALAAWTDPSVATPIGPVLPGGRLYNSYRGQADQAGRIIPGLISLGDAVCTTNPAAGRGVTTSLLQARQLLTLLGAHGRDHASCTLAFDTWCERAIKPWFTDHVRWDTDLTRRWAGGDIDLTRPLPSDLIVAAAEAEPALASAVGPYLGMRVLPGSLQAVEPMARAVYATGWRPPVPPGPDLDELADLIMAADTAAAPPAVAPA